MSVYESDTCLNFFMVKNLAQDQGTYNSTASCNIQSNHDDKIRFILVMGLFSLQENKEIKFQLRVYHRLTVSSMYQTI